MSQNRFMMTMPDDQIERLALVMERTGAPRAEILRRAVDLYLTLKTHVEGGGAVFLRDADGEEQEIVASF